MPSVLDRADNLLGQYPIPYLSWFFLINSSISYSILTFLKSILFVFDHLVVLARYLPPLMQKTPDEWSRLGAQSKWKHFNTKVLLFKSFCLICFVFISFFSFFSLNFICLCYIYELDWLNVSILWSYARNLLTFWINFAN